MILFDTNVLVATINGDHEHHSASAPMVAQATRATAMVAAHSLSETYATLTRNNRPFRMSGSTAMAAITALSADLQVVALSATQTLDAIRRFSTVGSGPRLYDFLIGATGEAFGADTIVTWNTRDFDGLFPGMTIVTPDQSIR